MNDNLRKYIESINNTVWLYRYILNNKILEDENLKNIGDESKKELFDYIFDKYLDSENELNFLSIASLYYGFFQLKELKIFSSIEDYCRNKIKDTLSEKEKEIKINPNIRNIFMHLDMALFIGEENSLSETAFSQYLQTIADKIKNINYGNAQFYTKSVQLIFIIKLLIGKINAKNDIDEILNVIKKFDEYGQYNILEYIICSLELVDKDKIKDNLIYDNLIKYSIELFNEDRLKKSSYNRRITQTLKYIIDNVSDDVERLKYILDIYFTKYEKELNEIYKYIDYEKRHMLDIPIYCLLKLKESNNNIKEILSPAQYNLIICYLALNVRKDKKIIIKDINEEEIDLSIYWDLVREEFIEICNNYEMKKYGFIFLQKYIGILQALYPTVEKKEFNKFSEEMKNFFYYHLIKKEDNKELYKLIPEGVKRQFEINKRYKEKIEEEKELFQKERVECIHKFFDKNEIIKDIEKIVEVLGNTPTFYDLSSYNSELYRGKFENKEKFIEEMDTNERLIVNPFIIDYFLIVSKYLIKDISMNKIEKYINDYWDKHWGIHLYNYLKQNSDIIDKVSFDKEEKKKIEDYFKSYNYSETIKDLHNCLKGTVDNSYLYFIYYNIENIFKDIKFKYDEEILVNMLKIPYYYLRGSIKLYNNNYYLEDCGIIAQGYEDKIKFEHFFKDKELKKSVLGKLIESIDKDRITDEFGLYYTLKSIIKLYNSDKEKYKFYYDNIIEFVIHFYELSLNKVKYSSISIIINNFIQENNLDLNILNFIVKGNRVNYDHLKYINDLQKKLLEEGKLYDSNDYYHNCYLLIYEIRNKINSKDIEIIHNVSPDIVRTIKNEITKFDKYKNINYLEQENFSKFKSDLIDIYNKFIKDIDFNSEENMIYENLLYLQSFIKEYIKIWENFTEFLINNKDYYYKNDILENLIFKSLFNKIDKNNFDFNFFIDKLVLLYNSIIEKTYKDGIIPNENLIVSFLNIIIEILIDLELLEEKLYRKIYDSIPFLDENVKEILRRKIFNEFRPVKIEIKDNNYIVYNLKDNSIYKKKNIDELVEWLVPNNNNKVSRILRFEYLLNDIKKQSLTISHPHNFEDPNENSYCSEDKIYIVCFSRTINELDAYAWWKIYGQVPDNKFKNVKIRINFNKRELIKNLLKDKNSDYIYYFGDIDYSAPKDATKANIEIKDFFYKSYAFKFENEFRILIECKNMDNKNMVYNSKNIPYLLKLPANSHLYRDIIIDRNSFNPYKQIKINTKEKIKNILIAYKKKYIRKNKKNMIKLHSKFITIIRRYIKNNI